MAKAENNQSAQETPRRQHRATYARDKRAGGYLIRVEGPNANKFAGREVPVTMMNGDEHSEKLTSMIWFGADEKTGKPVALYKFEAKPREDVEEPF